MADVVAEPEALARRRARARARARGSSSGTSRRRRGRRACPVGARATEVTMEDRISSGRSGGARRAGSASSGASGGGERRGRLRPRRARRPERGRDRSAAHHPEPGPRVLRAREWRSRGGNNDAASKQATAVVRRPVRRTRTTRPAGRLDEEIRQGRRRSSNGRAPVPRRGGVRAGRALGDVRPTPVRARVASRPRVARRGLVGFARSSHGPRAGSIRSRAAVRAEAAPVPGPPPARPPPRTLCAARSDRTTR